MRNTFFYKRIEKKTLLQHYKINKAFHFTLR